MLDALGDRDDVDVHRVGAVGVSLGGYYAPRAAAFEPRVHAIAAISGPYEFGARWEDLPPLTREAFTVKSGARDEREARERAGDLTLRGVASKLTQPALFVTGGQDRIVPWRETERAAREAPNGNFVLFEHGSHVCSNIPYLYRPLVGDWMAEQLEPARR
jgi:2,6-dihydroxypseudooxynicotine hydrolase